MGSVCGKGSLAEPICVDGTSGVTPCGRLDGDPASEGRNLAPHSGAQLALLPTQSIMTSSSGSLADLDSSQSEQLRCVMLPTYTSNPHSVLNERLVIAMVGLPARGKSYISKALMRYLNFLGCPTQLFNAGNMRRKEGMAGTDASFFSASNTSAKVLREAMAMTCLGELLTWLQEITKTGGCACGIFDAVCAPPTEGSRTETVLL